MMQAPAFPQGFIEQLAPLLGPELPDFLRCYEQAPARGLRVRRPGDSPPAEAAEPVPWAEGGFYLPLESAAGTSPLHEAGAYYLQEPSAMAAAAALHPLPGEKVLDLCAAPGGKSTQLAAYLGGKGLLMCNEPVPSRAQILSRNMERMGVSNAVVVSALPEELSPRFPGYFDRILVDAPCSGEGMFRRHPETRDQWTAAAPAGCAQRQGQILLHAAQMLRPGGLLAYSTCTLNAEENEGVIQRFLWEQPDFSLVPFALPGLPESDGTLRLWPHRIRGEGHFVALLRKRGDAAEGSGAARPAKRPRRERESQGLPRPSEGDAALARDFLREHIADAPMPNALFAGKLIAAPEGLPPLQGVKVLRAGLALGEIKGRVFVPDHALALCCRPLRWVDVTLEQARAYQAGQALPAPEGVKGFCVLVCQGWSLGWVKAVDGQLKNHYPKGLRRP